MKVLRFARIATTFTSTLLAMQNNSNVPVNNENSSCRGMLIHATSSSGRSDNCLTIDEINMIPSEESLFQSSQEASSNVRPNKTRHAISGEGYLSPNVDSSSSHATFCAYDIMKRLPALSSQSYCKRIYLIRHGETDWNAMGRIQGGGNDIELNQNGIIQANMVGDVLQQIQFIAQREQQQEGSPIQLVVSSHLERSEQTANIIYGKLVRENQESNLKTAIQRLISDKFGEMRFGQFEGIRKNPTSSNSEFDLYNVHSQMMLTDPTLRWPGGGESRQDVINRIESGLQQIYTKYPEISTICIVAHSRLNKILLHHLVPSSCNYDVDQGNTCINVLDYNSKKKEYDARVINYVDHHNEWQ